MPRTSSKVQRLEKEAILRSKNYQYTREQSDNYISGLNIEVEDENTERHRRHIATRPIRQIQREIDYPVEPLDKMTERIQQEIKRKQQAAAATLASATARNHYSSSVDDRSYHDSGNTGKYTSTKHNSKGKI